MDTFLSVEFVYFNINMELSAKTHVCIFAEKLITFSYQTYTRCECCASVNREELCRWVVLLIFRCVCLSLRRKNNHCLQVFDDLHFCAFAFDFDDKIFQNIIGNDIPLFFLVWGITANLLTWHQSEAKFWEKGWCLNKELASYWPLRIRSTA